MDESLISLKNFKKRPRQPSLLRMVQQSIASDKDTRDETISDATLDSREDSQIRAPHNHDPNLSERGRGRSTRQRKRKISELHDSLAPSSPPQLSDATSHDHLPSDPIELPPVRTVVRHGWLVEHEPYSETAAPPRSSSSLERAYDESQIPKRMPVSGKKRSIYVDPPSPPSSPDVRAEVRTRNRRGTAKRRQGGTATLTTADLLATLPRRRQTRASISAGAFGVASSSEHDIDVEPSDDNGVSVSEDDEVQQRRPRRRARDQRRTAFTPAAPNPHQKPTRAMEWKKGAASSSRPTRPQVFAAASTPASTVRVAPQPTYSRRSSSKENSPNLPSPNVTHEVSLFPDEQSDGPNGSPVRVARSKTIPALPLELDAAARKFAEIDQWEMEFETCDLGGGGSSSPRWR